MSDNDVLRQSLVMTVVTVHTSERTTMLTVHTSGKLLAVCERTTMLTVHTSGKLLTGW